MKESAKMVDTKAVSSARVSRLTPSDQIEGAPVCQTHGQTVGAIEKLMIDMETGELTHVVVSFDEILGLSEGQRVLPWGMLRYNGTVEAFELDITEERLREMPTAFDWEKIRLAELPGGLTAGPRRRRDSERSGEVTSAESEAELELNALLERLDRKVAAEHVAMDKLLERIAVRAVQ